MGYYCHHVIIAVTWRDPADLVGQLNLIRERVCPEMPPVTASGAGINAFRTILIPADGSKEGWADSDRGDAARAEMKDLLQASDHCCDWVEVEMGDDSPHHISDDDKTRSATE